jgi:SAM-dependent methyltransferase
MPAEMAVAVSACPFCGATEFRPYFAGETGVIVRCARCHGLFTRDRTGEIVADADAGDAVKEEYSETYRDNEAAEWAIARNLLDLLRQHVPNARTYLEIGCGNAAVARAVASADQANVVYTGIEISRPLYDAIDESVRSLVVHEVTLESALARISDGSQDVVILHHVLEHLPEPRVALGLIRRKLAPGGHLFIEVPNEQWKRAIIRLRRLLKRRGDDWFPGHINFFTQSSLRKFLRSEGFEVEFEDKLPAARYLDMVKKMLGGETAYRRNPLAQLVYAVLRSTKIESLIGYGIVLRCICSPREVSEAEHA